MRTTKASSRANRKQSQYKIIIFAQNHVWCCAHLHDLNSGEQQAFVFLSLHVGLAVATRFPRFCILNRAIQMLVHNLRAAKRQRNTLFTWLLQNRIKHKQLRTQHTCTHFIYLCIAEP